MWTVNKAHTNYTTDLKRFKQINHAIVLFLIGRWQW